VFIIIIIIICFSIYCVVAVKVTSINLLSKWYTLPSSCLCLCVRVFVCLFVYDYINIDLWAAELLKIELLLLLLLLLLSLFTTKIIINIDFNGIITIIHSNCITTNTTTIKTALFYILFEVFYCFLLTRANFVIGLCAVKFSRK
jgi:hypothetical protein